MKGIISSHSALNAYQRQTAIDPVSVPESPAPSERTGSSTNVRAARVSISEQARALARGDGSIDESKVQRLREGLKSGTLRFDSQIIAERMIDQAE
jgi:flagellar biosynthesis anti-sigma factor FlgM